MIQKAINKVYKMTRSQKTKIPPKIQVLDLNSQHDNIALSRIAMHNSYINKEYAFNADKTNEISPKIIATSPGPSLKSRKRLKNDFKIVD
jgi:hypothetical protein